MRKYEVIINGKTFVKTRTKDLAERTLKMAIGYGLTGTIEEIEEDDSEEPEERI